MYIIRKKTNKYYINEPNTIPGSLSFYLWDKAGKRYEDLLDEMITLSIKDYKNRTNKTHSFETNILAGYTGGMKGMKGTITDIHKLLLSNLKSNEPIKIS